MEKAWLFKLLVLYCLILELICDDAPIIETKFGPIQGYSELNAFVYLGIPFATPPLGNLRWTDPVEPNPWSPNVLNATAFKPACPQRGTCHPSAICPTSFGEDCLYLNVYVPQTVKQGDKKAVMMYLHGGNFQYTGSNTPLHNGSFLAGIGDLIVVTTNYRLGALGFLVTGLESDQLQGNFGIKDQKMAIKWVHDNIAAFGGDNEKITLFGQSAGAQSVSIHVLSADVQPYFNNAIIQSSPMSIPFKKLEEQLLLYEYFADGLNCTAKDIACLKSKAIDDIVAAQMKAENFVSSLKLLEFFEPWTPYIDGTVIKGQLLEIDKWLADQHFQLKPLIIGSLTEECVFYIYSAWKNPLNIENYLELDFVSFKENAIKVLEQYPPDFNNKDQRDMLSGLATTWVFSCSTRNYLETYMKYAPQNTYWFYVWDFPLDFDGWEDLTFCNNRVCHGADVPYTFDVDDSNYTANGHLLAMQHIAYWSNYAKNGTPNANNTYSYKGFTVKELLFWPKYDTNNRYDLRFKAQPNIIEANFMKEKCDFFDSIGYYH